MGYAVKLQQFEGPLDILLDLIEKEKLDISQLSLATVTDDYLKHLDANPEIPPEELADFLTVAAKLLYIKSQALLPFLNFGEPEEEEGNLEDQLKIYREYVEASKGIEAAIGRNRFLFAHDKLPSIEIGFSPPKKLTTDQMAVFMRTVIARLEPVVKTPQAVVERTVSIHDKIERIRNLLSRATGRFSFRSILEEAESRVEVVVCFLALLEMIKQKSVRVDQDGRFEEITISRVDIIGSTVSQE